MEKTNMRGTGSLRKRDVVTLILRKGKKETEKARVSGFGGFGSCFTQEREREREREREKEKLLREYYLRRASRWRIFNTREEVLLV